MAITEVTKIWSGEGSRLNKELDFESKGSSDHVEVYDAIVDDPENDDAYTVKTSSSVKQIGDQLGTNNLWVTDVDARRETPILFKVVVSYSSFSINPQDPDSNPFQQPAKVKWKTFKATGEIDEDINGNPIATPNGEPVEGVQRPFSDLAAVISQPFPSFDAPAFYNFIDHVNSRPFLGFPAGSGKVETIDADPQIVTVESNPVTYYTVAVEVLFRKPIRTTPDKAWYNRRVIKGNLVKNIFGTIARAKDADGELLDAPVYLDANGFQVTKENAVWAEDEILGKADLNSMGFNL